MALSSGAAGRVPRREEAGMADAMIEAGCPGDRVRLGCHVPMPRSPGVRELGAEEHNQGRVIHPHEEHHHRSRCPVDLLYLSTSFLWWQAVAGIRESNRATRCAGIRGARGDLERARETSTTPPSAARSARCAPAGASLQTSRAAPEAWHRSGTLARSGTPRWRTREEQRPHRLTMPRDALPARLSSLRLLAMASPHGMLVGSS